MRSHSDSNLAFSFLSLDGEDEGEGKTPVDLLLQ